MYNFVSMNTDRYISQLLYRYQCVIVPGFGAFLTEIQPAELDESSSSFYPPKKLISFNSNLKNNDGLLANHLAQAEKISYENAIDSIQDQVTLWKQQLYTNGRFTINNVGELSLNSEHNLVFFPSDNANYLTDSFGLAPFVSKTVERVAVRNDEQKPVEEVSEPIVIPISRRYTVLKYAAIIVVALSTATVVGYSWNQNRIAEETLLVESAVQQKVQNKIQEATFFIENPLPGVTLNVSEKTYMYHIVAGAFRSESNADNALRKLKQQGFDARRIPQNRHGLYPVLFGSFETYPEAVHAMTKIRKTTESEAWLLVKDL